MIKGAFDDCIVVHKSLENVEFIICLGSENRLKKSLHCCAVLLMLKAPLRDKIEHNLNKK